MTGHWARIGRTCESFIGAKLPDNGAILSSSGAILPDIGAIL